MDEWMDGWMDKWMTYRMWTLTELDVEDGPIE